MKRINLNTVLLVLGAAALFAPDVAEVAAMLAGTGVPWLGTVARVFGAAALLLSSLPRIIGRLRPILAALGLATPPEQVEPAKPEPRQPDKGAVPDRCALCGHGYHEGTCGYVSGQRCECVGERPGTAAGRQRDRGAVPVVVMLFLAVVFAVVAAAHRSARAEQFGGCFASGQLCAGPSASVMLGEYNVTTGKFAGGASPGLGYGLTFAPDQWYATGLSLNLAFTVGGDANFAKPSAVFSFANYVRFGVAAYLFEGRRELAVIGGIGSDFGGSPSYVRAARAAQ